jgi:hypothetical protein
VEVTTCHSLLLIASAGRGYLGSRRKERGLIPPTSSRPPRASPRDLEISAPRYNGDNHLTADRGTWIRGDTTAKPSPAVANIPLRPIPARAAQLPRIRAQTTASASSFELSCQLTLKWPAARCRALLTKRPFTSRYQQTPAAGTPPRHNTIHGISCRGWL